MKSLFNDSKRIKLPNADLYYYPKFYNNNESEKLFQILKENIDWQLYDIKLFGKTHKQPRLTAFYNDSQFSYTYSKLVLKTHKMTKDLKEIRNKIEAVIGVKFNSVLLNYYRDGNDSNGWHADDEKSLGPNPIIASLSLGGERPFYIRHNTVAEQKHKINLENGSLLVMAGEMQHYYKHQIAKTKKQVGERINLTFRTLKF